ncbi:MAG TPA: 3-hydroxyacyl-ACP dehydratase [Niabella sp.]|nr:3-hydroxyacyl-ACP dehydratase [Chitinophagaceae bacterium]HUN01935.1 3-hydroxyacyl-ACP dehydratase [Niabella sp.]
MSIATDILSFIPQRPPFVMVDTIEACDEAGATTTFTVREDNIFVENDLLQEPALIENIAQTAAAHNGFMCLKDNKPVPVGFIGAVQSLKIEKLPKISDVLSTSITIKNQIFNATIIQGQITCNGEEIAGCEMKIFISEQ